MTPLSFFKLLPNVFFTAAVNVNEDSGICSAWNHYCSNSKRKTDHMLSGAEEREKEGPLITSIIWRQSISSMNWKIWVALALPKLGC